MAERTDEHATFAISDCALLTIATGERAVNLRELAQGLRDVELASIYHHFWGRLLQPQFDEPEYNNDFASWAHHELHDKTVAERLSAVDPVEYHDTEELRQELLEIVEMRLDESEKAQYERADQQFHFLRSQLVALDTHRSVNHPDELAEAIAAMNAGSIYYHFIDARRRTESHFNDFSVWLAGWGDEYRPLIRRLSAIDPYFSSLQHIREMLVDACHKFITEPDLE
jgi:hypothetical protein